MNGYIRSSLRPRRPQLLHMRGNSWSSDDWAINAHLIHFCFLIHPSRISFVLVHENVHNCLQPLQHLSPPLLRGKLAVWVEHQGPYLATSLTGQHPAGDLVNQIGNQTAELAYRAPRVLLQEHVKQHQRVPADIIRDVVHGATKLSAHVIEETVFLWTGIVEDCLAESENSLADCRLYVTQEARHFDHDLVEVKQNHVPPCIGWQKLLEAFHGRQALTAALVCTALFQQLLKKQGFKNWNQKVFYKKSNSTILSLVPVTNGWLRSEN